MEKSIVFDMDGVIFDTETLVISCWDKVGKKYNIKNTGEVCRKCIGTNANKTAEIFKENYGKDFSYEKYSKEVSKLFHEIEDSEGIPVKKGARELLEYLRENNYKIGLASSTKIEIVTKELKDANLYNYFDTVVGGDMLKKSKPEPDIYLLACEKLNVNPKETFAIEDSFNGIKSAYRAKMKAIMVPDMLKPNEEIKEYTFKIFNDLFEVKDYLENNN